MEVGGRFALFLPAELFAQDPTQPAIKLYLIIHTNLCLMRILLLELVPFLSCTTYLVKSGYIPDLQAQVGTGWPMFYNQEEMRGSFLNFARFHQGIFLTFAVVQKTTMHLVSSATPPSHSYW